MPVQKNDVPVKLPKRQLPKRSPLTAEDTFEPPSFAKKTKDPTVVMQPPYHCHCTYKDFPEQKGNFYLVGGELFAANNGYFPVSKTALEGYFKKLYQDTGDLKIALHRIAQYLDLYINDDIIEIIRAADDKNPVSRLAQVSRKRPYTEKTYIDVMQEERIAEQLRTSSSTADGQQREAEVPERAIELFGLGYEQGDYAILLQHYDTLRKQCRNLDGVKESRLKDMCDTKLMQIKARIRGDVDDYSKLTKIYQDAVKELGLTSNNDEAASNDENLCFGTILNNIEQFCPGEVYTESIFDDVDSIKERFERFILRPVKNFFSGTREMDPEYSITPEELSDDGA